MNDRLITFFIAECYGHAIPAGVSEPTSRLSISGAYRFFILCLSVSVKSEVDKNIGVSVDFFQGGVYPFNIINVLK